MSESSLMDLIYSLIGYPNETEWLEFKVSTTDPKRIGEDISALANAAAFHGRDYGYKIWGVEDDTHQLVGTSFNYLNAKATGNQDLPIWLAHQLTPNASYEFDQIDDSDGRHFVVLKVRAAVNQPVRFNNTTYMREGNATAQLIPSSRKEEELWRRLQRSGFECQVAAEDIPAEEVQKLLAVEAYYSLIGLRQPAEFEAALLPLIEQELVKQQDNGLFSITNVGAMLLARRISAFPGLRKRALRVIQFDGKGSFNIRNDRTFEEGYALALPQAEAYLASLIPAEEVLDGAFRRIVYAYPPEALRELLVNAVVHQDATVSNAGPLVKIYDTRVEFSNPGSSLIPVERVLNAQPKTRNNIMVGMLRLMDLCEEGGTGWDRAVAACEARHMPAPRITSDEELGTTVTLFSGNAYDRMTKSERMDALYWHACLQFAQDEPMNNQSLRQRFGLTDERKNTLAMSRLIREAIDAGFIKEEDESAGTKYKSYVPSWA